MNINRKPTSIQLLAWNPSENGLEVVDVEYSTDQLTWQVLSKRQLSSSVGSSKRPQCGFPRFIVEGIFALKSRIHFRILLRELDRDYSFCLVDRLRGNQLWSAATKRKFTDVELVVGGKSFHATFNPDEKLAKYEIINCDSSAFEQLLFFVYTGSLQASADSRDLLQLGREYGIATLQSVCELALETNFQSVTDGDLLGMSLAMKRPV